MKLACFVKRTVSFGCSAGLLVLGVVACSAVAFAQTSSAQKISMPMKAGPETVTDDNRYRIGPGDVLEIRVLKAPELSLEAIRVDQRGMIRLPMVEGEVRAACSTETELSEKIATLYREYKRNPNVAIFVKEFQSQPVAVIGAVNNFHPEGTQFKLQRQVRLLELLTLAGGLSDHAGRTVNVVHSGGASLCEPNAGAAQADTGLLITYKLEETMRGVPEANPVLRPGDVVVVPEGDQIYVVGNVIKPSTIALKEPLTVSRAIAMAGGTAPATKRTKVRVVRQIPGSDGAKQEIFVDLNAIEKRSAIDLALLPNDIVDVPTDGTKTFLRSLMGAVAPTVSNGAVRVIN
jgi:polysaccharide biosynthesis/export protein